MKTGDRGLFLYDVLRGGLPDKLKRRLDAEPGAVEQRQSFLRRARDEGKFEALAAALELLPRAARELIRAGVREDTRATLDAGPSDRTFFDEGLRDAKAEGLTLGKRDGVFVLLHVRGLSLAPEQRERVLACADVAELDRWLRIAATAKSVDALFAH